MALATRVSYTSCSSSTLASPAFFGTPSPAWCNRYPHNHVALDSSYFGLLPRLGTQPFRRPLRSPSGFVCQLPWSAPSPYCWRQMECIQSQRLSKGPASAADSIGVSLPTFDTRGEGQNSDVVMDYIVPNVGRSVWFLLGYIAPLRHFQVQQDYAAVPLPACMHPLSSMYSATPSPSLYHSHRLLPRGKPRLHSEMFQIAHGVSLFLCFPNRF